MTRRLRSTVGRTVSLASLTAAVTIATYRSGGGDYYSWNIILASLGVGALASVDSRFLSQNSLEKLAVFGALAFPAFVAVQLLPLPVALLSVIDPTRAELARAAAMAAGGSSWLTAVSIVPEYTAHHLSRVVGYVLVFLVIRGIARQLPGSRWWLLFPLIAIATAQALFGLAQHIQGAPVAGTFASRNFFAGTLAMALPCALLWGISLIASQSDSRRPGARAIVGGALLCAAAALMFAVITLALSRMAFVSCLASLGLMGFLALPPRMSGLRKLGTAGALIAAAALFVVFAPSDDLLTRLGGTAADETLAGRLPIAVDTLRMARHYPLLGIGLGAFFPGLLPYQEHLLNYTITNAHNDYLQALAELGLLGALPLAALVTSLLVINARRSVQQLSFGRRALPVACIGALSAMLIHSSADFNFYVPANAMVFFWIAGVASVGTARTSNGEDAPTPSLLPFFAPGLALRLVGSAAIVYAVLWLVFLRADVSVERESRFCAVGVCDSAAMQRALRQTHGDLPSAPLSVLAELVRRSPAAPYAWCDLGESLQKSGRITEARFCFTRALALAPHIPFMLIRAARFQFATGSSDEALALMSRALTANPGWGEVVFGDYDNWRIPVDRALAQGLPPTAAAGEAYLLHLSGAGRYDEARDVWQRVLSLGDTKEETAQRYIEALFRNRDPGSAFEAWWQYQVARTGAAMGIVSNGGFEEDPAPVRFDWGISRLEGVAISFDRETKYSGSRSLRVDFNEAENPTDLRIRQTVYLEGGKYRLRAYVRTQGLTTDEGIAVSVRSEEGSAQLDVVTQDVKGTNEWTLVEREFEVRPGGVVASVGMVRKRTFRFDRYVRGTAYIDNVSITPVPPV